MLHSNGRRERIIVYGDYGSGKSQAWVEIARMLRATKSPAKVHVICSDGGAEASLEQYDGWEENVSIVNVWEFEEYSEELKARREKDGRDDWLVVDRSDLAWEAVQDSFAMDVSGKEYDIWATERLASGDAGSVFSDAHGNMWGIIKKRYNGRFSAPIQRYPGHVLLCAASRPVARPDNSGRGGDGADVVDYYGRQGTRPAGEKHTGFIMHDIVKLGCKGPADWVMMTIRARSRPVVVNVPLRNFVTDYLIPIGGWGL